MAEDIEHRFENDMQEFEEAVGLRDKTTNVVPRESTVGQGNFFPSVEHHVAYTAPATVSSRHSSKTFAGHPSEDRSDSQVVPLSQSKANIIGGSESEWLRPDYCVDRRRQDDLFWQLPCKCEEGDGTDDEEEMEGKSSEDEEPGIRLPAVVKFKKLLLSVLVLFNAIYIGLIVLHISTIWDMHDSSLTAVLVLAVATLPPLLLLVFLVPQAFRDYAIATSVEEYIDFALVYDVLAAEKLIEFHRICKLLTTVRKQSLMWHDILSEKDKRAVTHRRHQALPASVRREIELQFDAYDENGDGAIELIEFETILNSVGGGHYSTSHMRKVFNRLDEKGQGIVKKAEFVQFMCDHFSPLEPTEEIDALFAMIDRDNSGKIEFRELSAFLLGWWAGYRLVDAQNSANASPLIGWFPHEHVELLPDPFAIIGDQAALHVGSLDQIAPPSSTISRQSMEAGQSAPTQASKERKLSIWRRMKEYRGKPRARVIKAWPTTETDHRLTGPESLRLEVGDIVVLTERPHAIGELTPEDVAALVQTIEQDVGHEGTIEKKELRHVLRHTIWS
eukprot:SAG31_NODE_2278_length_6027_cov_1.979588_2_plen_560_part_00